MRAHGGGRPAALFLEVLDRPELKLLNIKFPGNATPKMFLDVVRTARDKCLLNTLEDLTLKTAECIRCAESASAARRWRSSHRTCARR